MNFRLALVALGILSAFPAIANPVYYTFTGVVDTSNHPEYAIGQSVTHTFLVDQLQAGFYSWNGIVQTSTPSGSFYSEYIGGDALPTEVYEAWYGVVEFHWGSQYGPDTYGTGVSYSTINGSNQDAIGYDNISIIHYGETVDEWNVGMEIRGHNVASVGRDRPEGTSDLWRVYSSLTLVGISDTNPYAVPEPSSMILISLGSILLVGYRRRKDQKGSK